MILGAGAGAGGGGRGADAGRDAGLAASWRARSPVSTLTTPRGAVTSARGCAGLLALVRCSLGGAGRADCCSTPATRAGSCAVCSDEELCAEMGFAARQSLTNRSSMDFFSAMAAIAACIMPLSDSAMAPLSKSSNFFANRETAAASICLSEERGCSRPCSGFDLSALAAGLLGHGFT